MVGENLRRPESGGDRGRLLELRERCDSRQIGLAAGAFVLHYLICSLLPTYTFMIIDNQ